MRVVEFTDSADGLDGLDKNWVLHLARATVADGYTYEEGEPVDQAGGLLRGIAMATLSIHREKS